MAFTPSQTDTLVVIMMIAKIIGLLGSVFVIINYFLIKSLQNQLSYKLILWIAITDAIYSTSGLFGGPTNEILCTLQGIVSQSGSLSSTLWVVAISWTIHYLMNISKLPTKGELKHTLYIIHGIIWTITIIGTFGPLLTNSYGPAGGWCWIKSDKTIDNVWRMAAFYVIVWLTILYTIFTYITTWIKLKKESKIEEEKVSSMSSMGGISTADDTDGIELETRNNTDGTGKADQATLSRQETVKSVKRSRALRRMALFPLILIICYLPGSIRRIADFVSPGSLSSYWLAVIQILLNGLIGFFDALIYGLTKDVRKKDKQFLQRLCCDE